MAKSSIPKNVAAQISKVLPKKPTASPAMPLNPAPLMAPVLLEQQRASAPSPLPAPTLPPVPPAYVRAATQEANTLLTQPPPTPQAVAVPDHQPYPLGRFPWLNEKGYEMKRTPIIGDAFGGAADFATNLGTPRLSGKNAAALSWDLVPFLKVAKVVKPLGTAINRLSTAKQVGAESGLSFVPNPFEETLR